MIGMNIHELSRASARRSAFWAGESSDDYFSRAIFPARGQERGGALSQLIKCRIDRWTRRTRRAVVTRKLRCDYLSACKYDLRSFELVVPSFIKRQKYLARDIFASSVCSWKAPVLPAPGESRWKTRGQLANAAYRTRAVLPFAVLAITSLNFSHSACIRTESEIWTINMQREYI